jgi:hypothetical protein
MTTSNFATQQEKLREIYFSLSAEGQRKLNDVATNLLVDQRMAELKTRGMELLPNRRTMIEELEKILLFAPCTDQAIVAKNIRKALGKRDQAVSEDDGGATHG